MSLMSLAGWGKWQISFLSGYLVKTAGVQIAAFFFIFLFAGVYRARAGSPDRTAVIYASTDSKLVVAETITPQNQPSPEEQQESEPDQSPTSVPVSPELSGTQLDVCNSVMTDGATWLDRIHAMVQEKTCQPAVWFDSFFGEDHVLLDLRPGAFIMFRNSARLTEGLKVAYASDFSISLDLPRWESTLRHASLYIESRSEIDKSTVQQGQPIQPEPGLNQKTGVRQPIIGVRIDPYIKSLALLISVDSGVKINMHPNAFFRMRYQYSKKLGKANIIRLSEIAMYRAVEHFSNTVRFEVERNISTFSLVRWGSSINYIDDTPGVKWDTGISYFTLLTRKSAISFDTSVWGVNDPEWTIENYRVGVLYRLNFYRPWLFFEIEPEVTWPVDEKSGHRNPVLALMSTLEIQFGK
ncbi:MAG: hypothetical protein IT392_01240 [Nitrospirae bacterium]|nr:hypothetical protein [Nitrospirota bacterium]